MATRSKRTPRPPARAKAAIPKTGAVTLAEARALVQAKQPKRPARKLAAAAASPEAVGAEREKLDQERRDQIARRIREYKATMVIMKKRGVRRPRPKPVAKEGEPVAKAESFEPLQILAEGDSWFDYPVPLFGGGIIPRLEDRLGVPILSLAKAGDEVRYISSMQFGRNRAAREKSRGDIRTIDEQGRGDRRLHSHANAI